MGGRRSAQEGLDERGEAPPPYKPRDEEEGAGGTDVVSNEESRGGSGEERAGAGDGVVAIPMRTLGREDVGLKPPDYEETLVARQIREREEDLANGAELGSRRGDRVT